MEKNKNALKKLNEAIVYTRRKYGLAPYYVFVPQEAFDELCKSNSADPDVNTDSISIWNVEIRPKGPKGTDYFDLAVSEEYFPAGIDLRYTYCDTFGDYVIITFEENSGDGNSDYSFVDALSVDVEQIKVTEGMLAGFAHPMVKILVSKYSTQRDVLNIKFLGKFKDLQYIKTYRAFVLATLELSLGVTLVTETKKESI